MKLTLVINDNRDALLMPFKEKFQLFADHGKAVEHAKKIGFLDGPMSFGINPEVGMKNQFMAGDINVSIITLEVQQ